MTKTKIEYVDYTRNPIKGYCPNNCPYCYAHRRYNRFKLDKTIRFVPADLDKLKEIKQPSKIFIGSEIDMYHQSIPPRWVKEIIKTTRNYPGHTFITLTKFPENLSKYNFPGNWWIGITIDGSNVEYRLHLSDYIEGHNKRFISFEPILNANVTQVGIKYMDWIIIGGLTPKPVHKKEWIDDILRRADDFDIPVFIKNNANYPEVRRDYPE